MTTAIKNTTPEPTERKIHRSPLELLALSLFTALMLVVFLQFCTRYLLNDSLAWTEEIARYLMVCIVFTGSLILAQKGEHILLEVTYRLASRSNTKPLVLFAQLLSLIYYLVLAVFAGLLALKTEQLLISIPFPKALIYSFVAMTLMLSSWASFLRLKKLSKLTGSEIFEKIDGPADEARGI